MNGHSQASSWRTPVVVLLAGALVVNFSVGLRHGMGLLLTPMTADLGMSRENFSLAFAVQNLMWGISAPLLGMLADKYGSGRVVAATCVLYALGFFGMQHATTPLALWLTGGALIGIAQGGCTIGVITGAIGRATPPEQRQQALAISGALGAFGQFYLVPILQWLIGTWGWGAALGASALAMLAVAPLAIALAEPARAVGPALQEQSVSQALKEALRERGFILLCLGFFVCGIQVVFIGLHLPAYLRDKGMGAEVAVVALVLIAASNVAGTYWWGMQGARRPKRHLLSVIYALRAVFILAFLAVPLTPWSVYAFALAMGSLWLSTVPLTNGLVAQVFGVRYLSMLAGMVFLCHQIGSALGAWMGGALFDATGSYTLSWMVCAGLGVVAALLHLPIDERPVATRSAA
ncbi:MAG: MFS transporter [Burkholderiales bacterium]